MVLIFRSLKTYFALVPIKSVLRNNTNYTITTTEHLVLTHNELAIPELNGELSIDIYNWIIPLPCIRVALH